MGQGRTRLRDRTEAMYGKDWPIVEAPNMGWNCGGWVYKRPPLPTQSLWQNLVYERELWGGGL
ncbi:MAG: hypothetical protein DRI61_12385 [Chloroflexi bacterium]|nr:MAG: hypothetical protein DRI61_12385 [Chloroflexota bacterium]